MRGAFITFEGGEACGKTTQLRLLAKAFEQSAISFITTREPGGSALAENVRSLILQQHASEQWDSKAETLLFFAARAQHLARVIEPKREEGATVLCDRFADSTRVYQGIAKKLGLDWVDDLHRLCFHDLAPDCTFLLDIAPQESLRRARLRANPSEHTRFEAMEDAFHTQVREGFLTLAAREPARFITLNAALPEETLHREIISHLNARFGFTLNPAITPSANDA